MKTPASFAGSPPRQLLGHLAAAAVLLLVTAGLLALLSRASRPDLENYLQDQLSAFPAQLDDWRQNSAQEIDPQIVDVLGLDDWLKRRYDRDPGDFVWLYIGYMGPWDVGKRRQAYHSPRYCYPAGGWRIIEHGLQPVVLPDGRELLIDRMLAERGQERHLLLYWIQWGDRIEAEGKGLGWGAKISWVLQLPFRMMTNQRMDRTFVKITAPVIGSVDATLNRELDFIQALYPAVVEYFALETDSQGNGR
jgi:EpsI family protein